MFGDARLPEKFWAKVDVRPGPLPTDCWIWTGCQVGKYAKFGRGYGGIRIGKKLHSAHILAYETLVRKKPDGLVCDHLCDTPPCCNPDHIELVTNRANVLRGSGITAAAARRTRCGHGHAFTPENTIIRKSGARRCRRCHNEDGLRRYYRSYREKRQKARKVAA